MDSQVLFKIIFESSVFGSVSVIFVSIFKRLYRNKLTPIWHYYIWFLVIIRLLMPFSISYTSSPDNNTPVNHGSSTISRQVKLNTESAGTAQVSKTISSTESRVIKTPASVNTAKSVRQYSGMFFAPAKEKISDIFAVVSESSIIKFLWLLGCGIVSGYILIPYIVFQIRLKKEPICEDKAIISLFESCKLKMNVKRNIKIITSSYINIPTIAGFIKIKLLLSQDTAEKLNMKELEYIFLHELAHIKRHDIFVNWITSILLILHWFNPVIWYSFSEMKKDCEMSCDELALKYIGSDNRFKYGEVLIRLAEIISEPSRIAGTAAIINKSDIKKRIIAISECRKNSMLRIIAAALFITVVAYVSLTNGVNISAAVNRPVHQMISTEGNKASAAVTAEQDNRYESEKIPELTDSEIIDLIQGGDEAARGTESFFRAGSEFNMDGKSCTYGKLPVNIKDYDSMKNYLDEHYNFNKYFSQEFTKKFINYVFPIQNGEYIKLIGQAGDYPDYKKSYIISKSYNCNVMNVRFRAEYRDGSAVDHDTVLIYENHKWIIDKIDMWGIENLEK